MFDISRDERGQIVLQGRLDASQADKASGFFNQVTESATVDLKGLTYISSAGLGVLLATAKRLLDRGHDLVFVNLNGHIKEIFRVAGLDLVFHIE